MSLKLRVLALLLVGEAIPAHSAAPLFDPVALNIGVNCHWQRRCMTEQQRAMHDGLKYVAKYRPPVWRIQQCNRNASRAPQRVDWVGFNGCVRNAALTYRPPPPQRPASRSAKPHRSRPAHRRR